MPHQQKTLCRYQMATVRKNDQIFRLFADWCSRFGYDALPVSEEALIAYARDVGRSVSPNTFRRYIVALERKHADAGLSFPTSDDVEAAIISSRLYRSTRFRVPTSVTLRDLDYALAQMRHVTRRDDDVSLRNRLIVELMWGGLISGRALVGLRHPDDLFYRDETVIYRDREECVDVRIEGEGARGIVASASALSERLGPFRSVSWFLQAQRNRNVFSEAGLSRHGLNRVLENLFAFALLPPNGGYLSAMRAYAVRRHEMLGEGASSVSIRRAVEGEKPSSFERCAFDIAA